MSRGERGRGGRGFARRSDCLERRDGRTDSGGCATRAGPDRARPRHAWQTGRPGHSFGRTNSGRRELAADSGERQGPLPSGLACRRGVRPSIGTFAGRVGVPVDDLAARGRVRRVIGMSLVYPLVVLAAAYGLFLFSVTHLTPRMSNILGDFDCHARMAGRHGMARADGRLVGDLAAGHRCPADRDLVVSFRPSRLLAAGDSLAREAGSLLGTLAIPPAVGA